MSERQAMEEKLESLAQFPRGKPQPCAAAVRGRAGTLRQCGGSGVLLRDTDSEAQPPSRILESGGARRFVANTVAEIEVRSAEARFFSFICTPVPDKQYVNLYGRDNTSARGGRGTPTGWQRRFPP